MVIRERLSINTKIVRIIFISILMYNESVNLNLS